jgi:hypothetical protein
LVGDTLYSGLNYDNLTAAGPLWACPTMTANACTVLDNPGTKNGIYTLAAGAGYLWAGLENGLVWRCSLTNDNACANWDKAGQMIGNVAYDGQGNLGIVTGGISGNQIQYGVLWSCPTATANACTTIMPIGKNVLNGVAAGNGNIWASYVNYGPTTAQPSLSLNNKSTGTTPFKSCCGAQITYINFHPIQDTANLLFIPAGGPTTLGSARVQVPFVKDAERLATFCAKKGSRVMADVSVSGPYGMKVKRRVNLCKLYDANTVRSEIKFGALDHGQYRVTVQSRSFYGQADFVLNDNNVQDVSVTLRKRHK